LAFRLLLQPRVMAAALVLTCACGGEPRTTKDVAPPDPAAAFLNDTKPLRYHSARFELSVPLPDGRGWKIDDHRTPLLVATHAATGATLTLGLSGEPELMNRQRCEAALRERGLVKDAEFQTVDDEVIVGPGPYDTHITVAALPSTQPHRTLAGHVFLFGAHMKKCLFVHYETGEREGEDEATLSARLAVARLQILGGIQVEAFDAPDVGHRR
jgi:hypothetical protein